jgi:hypothetical protein
MGVLVAPTLVFFVFLVMINIHQQRAYKRLEADQLVRLVIPENQFRWHKAGKEILVDNRHFDCKDVKKQGELYYVTGVFDKEEDLLTQKLEDAASPSSESAWLNESGLFLVFFSDTHSFQVHHPQVIADNKTHHPPSGKYTSICTEPLSPPPNLYS